MSSSSRKRDRSHDDSDWRRDRSSRPRYPPPNPRDRSGHYNHPHQSGRARYESPGRHHHGSSGHSRYESPSHSRSRSGSSRSRSYHAPPSPRSSQPAAKKPATKQGWGSGVQKAAVTFDELFSSTSKPRSQSRGRGLDLGMLLSSDEDAQAAADQAAKIRTKQLLMQQAQEAGLLSEEPVERSSPPRQSEAPAAPSAPKDNSVLLWVLTFLKHSPITAQLGLGDVLSSQPAVDSDGMKWLQLLMRRVQGASEPDRMPLKRCYSIIDEMAMRWKLRSILQAEIMPFFDDGGAIKPEDRELFLGNGSAIVDRVAVTIFELVQTAQHNIENELFVNPRDPDSLNGAAMAVSFEHGSMFRFFDPWTGMLRRSFTVLTRFLVAPILFRCAAFCIARRKVYHLHGSDLNMLSTFCDTLAYKVYLGHVGDPTAAYAQHLKIACNELNEHGSLIQKRFESIVGFTLEYWRYELFHREIFKLWSGHYEQILQTRGPNESIEDVQDVFKKMQKMVSATLAKQFQLYPNCTLPAVAVKVLHDECEKAAKQLLDPDFRAKIRSK